MGFKEKKYIIAVCDICSTVFDTSDGAFHCFADKEGAKETVLGCEWTIKNGKLLCYDCIEEA